MTYEAWLIEQYYGTVPSETGGIGTAGITTEKHEPYIMTDEDVEKWKWWFRNEEEMLILNK